MSVDLDRIRRRVADDPALQAAGPAAARGPALRAAIARAVRAEQLLLDDRGLAAVVRDVTDLFTGLGPAERLLRAPDVTDVMINGPGEVWIERAGRLERTDVTYPDADAVRAAVLRVVGPQGLRFDRAHPTVDTRLADGSRLHAVGAPLTSAGPLVTVRRFATVAHSWDDLEAGDAVPPVARRLLTEAVADRRAIVCCGRTGTGKTTLLGVLLSEVSAAERVVVVEDAPELALRCPHAVRLETRPATGEGTAAIDFRDLVRQALRMRPDRIVVGEVRGTEVVDVLAALATGHEGCMTTVHARAADEALVRLEGMALLAGLPLAAIRAQLAVSLDLLVVLDRDSDGARGVRQIAEVEGLTADGRLDWRDVWRRQPVAGGGR
ncbi:MAG TPA: ATPase, T2SS/T4P/T4SS family [Euzebyales bacterium]